jgi:cell division protein FtsB
LFSIKERVMQVWRWAAALLLSFVLFLIYILIWSDQGYLAFRDMQDHSRTIEERLAGVEEENRRLSRNIRILKHDREHLEKVIKTETHWLKEDEVLYLFPSTP